MFGNISNIQGSNLPFVLSIQKSQIGLHAKSTVFLNESFWQICSSFWAIFLTPLFVHCNGGLSAYCQADKPQESWCIFRWQEEKVILNRSFVSFGPLTVLSPDRNFWTKSICFIVEALFCSAEVSATSSFLLACQSLPLPSSMVSVDFILWKQHVTGQQRIHHYQRNPRKEGLSLLSIPWRFISGFVE